MIAEDENAQLINIGQSVLHGYLMLSAIVDIPRNSYALRKLLFAAADMGLRFEMTPFRSESAHESAHDVSSLSVTVRWAHYATASPPPPSRASNGQARHEHSPDPLAE